MNVGRYLRGENSHVGTARITNRKDQMKSVPVPAGNHKMRGRLTKTLPCRCCVAQNFKWRERLKEAAKEVKEINQPMTVYVCPTHILTQISETFVDADLSIIKEILYFDGWTDWEECGGYLIFVGIDDSIQLCEYGYSVMADDNTNYFSPSEISKERSLELIEEMNAVILNED